LGLGGNVVDEPRFRSRTRLFRDRCEAGRSLAGMLRDKIRGDALVLAIPSGGVPVGYCICQELGVPLDVVVVRKVPLPDNPEAGFGAVTLDGTLVLNERLVTELGLSEHVIRAMAASRLQEIKERLEKFRAGREPADLSGKDLVLVDDGLASGYTMLAAVRSIRKQSPKQVIVAVPTAHGEALDVISPEVDMVYCLNIRFGPVFAVADAYVNWYDLNDEEVKDYLSKSWKRLAR
jgi:predicted phosphoribosyltransferase